VYELTESPEIPPFIAEMFRLDLTEEDINTLRETLKDMKSKVRILVFTSKNKKRCFACEQTEKLIDIIASASPDIGSEKAVHVEKYVLEENEDIFKKYNVERVPTVLLLDGAITYLGMPAGEEIKGLIETLIRISNNDHGLSESTVSELAKLEGKAVIETIVTPTCPYCPYAVLLANMFAYVSATFGSGNVKSVTVEAYENPDIADKYAVTSTPTIAINGRVVFIGLPYESQLLKAVKRLAKLYA
jgi:glutaredoxin-like protein